MQYMCSMCVYEFILYIPATTPWAPNPAKPRAGAVTSAGAPTRATPVPIAAEVLGLCLMYFQPCIFSLVF